MWMENLKKINVFSLSFNNLQYNFPNFIFRLSKRSLVDEGKIIFTIQFYFFYF